MNFLNIILSIILLFVGVYGLIMTFNIDKNVHNKTGDSSDITAWILSVIPLHLFKFIFFLFSLVPIGVVTGMWLQLLMANE
ncbi:hypothetical protein [Neobacillus soli]|uniref:hypothetical protein n=1 Tax=Neobacillus soli TaxID=220688 RepID=UPI000825E081|nr:hypothetical protein [Neobacillus soli]